MVDVDDRHDGLAGLQHLSLSGRTHRDDAAQRRVNLGVSQAHIGRGFVRTRLLHLSPRRLQIALLYFHLFAIGLSNSNLRFRCFHLVFESLDGRLGCLLSRISVIAILRCGHAAVEQALLAFEVLLIAPEIGLGLNQLGARGRQIGLGLAQRGIGLIVRPAARAGRGIHFCFERANIGVSRIEISGKFGRIQFRDQVSLVDFAAFVHVQLNQAPRQLRADDDIVARNDSRQGNVVAAWRGDEIQGQCDQEQSPDTVKKN